MASPRSQGRSGAEPRPRPGFLTPHPGLLSGALGLVGQPVPGENRGRQGQCLTRQSGTEPQGRLCLQALARPSSCSHDKHRKDP